MALLTACVVVLAAALLANLALTFGVIRRLRHNETHPALPGAQTVIPGVGTIQPAMKTPGDVVYDFVALTADDEPLSRASFDEPTLVVFLSTQCSSCRDSVPEVIAAARRMPGGRRNTLAVIVGLVAGGDDDAFEAFRADLEPVARVTRDIDGGQLPTVFGVEGFPAICVVDDGGVIRSSGYTFAEVALPIAAGRDGA